MARVQIADDHIDVHPGLLERRGFSWRSRRVPLLHIVGVQTRRADDLSHGNADVVRETHRWGDGVLYDDGASLFAGKNGHSPSRVLTIDLCHEDVDRVVVELEDESAEIVADRIRLAVAAAQANAIAQMRSRRADRSVPAMPASQPPPPLEEGDADSDSGAHGIPYRITPLPAVYSEPKDDDRSLARKGGWLIGIGAIGLITGSVILAGGLLPGLLAIGAGVSCALMGAIALAVVVQHLP